MRAVRIASVALLGAVALALTAPAATPYASPRGSTTGPAVTPSVIAPGGQVTLTAQGCSRAAAARSDVFDSVDIPPGGSVTATVADDAVGGSVHEVTFICNSSPTARAKVALTIATTAPAAGSPAPEAVQGGLGNGIAGLNTAEAAGGAALLVVAAARAVFVTRRRKQGRGH
ncbi:hypothetical protein ACFVXE_26110 [Streptomyces sp. NPDC058231]|uniref:hypothetical protein n=1 Tax=Streptomyces sp. NPDC058231 TaxID=3346392 RepID=UPI0036E408CC